MLVLRKILALEMQIGFYYRVVRAIEYTSKSGAWKQIDYKNCMLLTVSKTVIISVCISRIAISFGESVQLVSCNLPFCYGGVGAEQMA